MNQRSISRSLVTLGVTILAACADPADPELSEVGDVLLYGTSEQALAMGGTPWSSPVNVCWTNSDATVDPYKSRVRDLITDTWDRYSGLTFVWPTVDSTLCSAANLADPTFMPLQINDNPAFGGRCALGMGGRLSSSLCGGTTNCMCTFNTANDPNHLDQQLHGMEYAAVHELGHGLGMIHEHQRLDRPADIASNCVDPNTDSDDPQLWEGAGPYLQDEKDQYVAVSSTYLTQYDGLASAMTYCWDPDHDGVQGDSRIFEIATAKVGISPMDQLGIEMAYPFSFSRRPVALGGISNVDGSSAIIPSSISTTFTLDWLARGGHPSFFTSVTWRTAIGILPGSGPSRTFKPTNPTSLGVEATDVFARNHVRTWATFTPSDAQYNAVLGSGTSHLLL